MSVFLKIKAKSLAAEAAIIRKEERNSWGKFREHLHNHRVVNVRRAARNTLLAYAFLKHKGMMPLEAVESFSYANPNWTEVERMVVTYADEDIDRRVLKQRLLQWRAGVELLPIDVEHPGVEAA